MQVLWLTPIAWLGLTLVAVPVAIHLLVRQQTRRVDYPSLRFLRQSQLAAFRPRSPRDALLLSCRAAAVVAAIAALAGPVLTTSARATAYRQRVARAVVVEPGTAVEAPDGVTGDALVSRVFARDHLVDAVADANRWLAVQPPASRELVLVGTWRRGSVTAAALDAIPPSTGVRFVSTSVPAPSREVPWPVLHAGSGGALVLERRSVRLDDEATRVAPGVQVPVVPAPVQIVAATADQPLAEAALRAALSAGVRWSVEDTRVVVAWAGADESAVRGLSSGASLVRMSRPMPASGAASAVLAAIESVTAPATDALEPVAIGVEQLRAWSRPPAGVPVDAVPVDEGDRRWLWGLALGLLMLEHGLRRSPVAASASVETRVA